MASVATASRPSLSEPVAMGEVGAVAVTVLTSGFATIPDANATGTVNVSVLAAPTPTVAPVVPKLVWPVVPVTVPQFAVPEATHVTFADNVTPAGNGSETVTPVAFEGPALDTTTV